MADIGTGDLEGWLRRFAGAVSRERAHLTELDAAIGDADHGSNMNRGMQAVVTMLEEGPPTTTGALLTRVGMTLVSAVGGASGPLFGTLFLRMGTALGETDAVSAEAFADALRAGLAGVVSRGKAEAGDKTMYDALAPAVEAMASALADGHDMSEALLAASTAARAGRDATTPMLARRGRASYLGERSVGHQDPGATSVALLLDATTGMTS